LKPDDGLPQRQKDKSQAFGGVRDAPEIKIAFDDNRLASVVAGQYDQNLAHLERRLGVLANANGNHIGDVDGAIAESARQGSLFPPSDDAQQRSTFEQIATRKRGAVRARNAAQDAYLRLLRRCELVFAEGPAGTGKTWLAVGHAVSLLEQGVVERLILSRPAVEAGERLGFLPGDMREKVDPYLRPVYDALYDFMEARHVERGLSTGVIEIAPLAFMRGRTLTNAAILLDEAQNCTSMQMKMFLTRLGEGSRMIVTGDPSQIDLPPGQMSGLVEAVRILDGVEGIGRITFKEEDVVRHDLVRRIVKAYEEAGRGS